MTVTEVELTTGDTVGELRGVIDCRLFRVESVVSPGKADTDGLVRVALAQVGYDDCDRVAFYITDTAVLSHLRELKFLPDDGLPEYIEDVIMRSCCGTK
ncbi:hypothetical protein FACS1894133_7660 [Clostridia bacterium]|nr:hypothetical protein FACS1894133_7660 [Clostridia bacterium]